METTVTDSRSFPEFVPGTWDGRARWFQQFYPVSSIAYRVSSDATPITRDCTSVGERLMVTLRFPATGKLFVCIILVFRFLSWNLCRGSCISPSHVFVYDCRRRLQESLISVWNGCLQFGKSSLKPVTPSTRSITKIWRYVGNSLCQRQPNQGIIGAL